MITLWPRWIRPSRWLFLLAGIFTPLAAFASVEFTQHFLELEPGSKFRLTFDVNGDNRMDAEASGVLRGRIDADLRLSDTGPSPVLQAFRLRRLTIRPDPQLEVIGTGTAAGYKARLVNASLHLGDGLGRTGTDAVVSTSSIPETFSWVQPNDNLLAARGSLRVRGADGEFDELLDLAQADMPAVSLSGSWQTLDLGTRSRLTLRHTSFQKIRVALPITVFIEITLDATAPLAAPPAPTTFAAWAASSGLTGPDSSPTADPDHDGRTNLTEYGDATHPRSADTFPGAVGVEIRNGRPTFLLTRQSNRTDLGYRLETSDDLITWKTLAAAMPDSDAGGVAGGQVVEESLAHPGLWLIAVQDPSWRLTGPKKYARLVYERVDPR